jgi:hypothetical protein
MRAAFYFIKCYRLSTTGKLVYVISRLFYFKKSVLRLFFKIKAALFET